MTGHGKILNSLPSLLEKPIIGSKFIREVDYD
jgi:hypothetical protein